MLPRSPSAAPTAWPAADESVTDAGVQSVENQDDRDPEVLAGLQFMSGLAPGASAAA
jgi:hypothetical protein